MFKKIKLLLIGFALTTGLLSGCSLINRNYKIKLSDTALNLNLSGLRSQQINATVYDEKTNKEYLDAKIIWDVENSNVASVENGLVKGVSEGQTRVVARLENNANVKEYCTINVIQKGEAQYDYTLMFYMSGFDLESDDGLFSIDLVEMLSVPNKPDNVRILIETGGTKKWHMGSNYLVGATSISAEYLQRWEIIDNKLKLIKTLDTNEMAKKESFQSFLEWGLEVESNQIGVVLSGHGAGIGGALPDDNYKYVYQKFEYEHVLDTAEIALATKDALSKTSRDKFSFIGYDCCMMQVADLATVYADYFDYMIASQEYEEGHGWEHDEYLPDLYANSKISVPNLLTKISSTFVKHNDDYNCIKGSPCYQTLSVLDLSKVGNLISSFEELSQDIKSKPNYFSKIRSTIENKDLYRFGSDSYGDLFGLADFKQYLQKLATFLSNIDISNVLDAIEELVIFKTNCKYYSFEPCGIDIFVAIPVYDKGLGLQVGKENYNTFNHTKFTTWQSIMIENGSFGW